MTPLLNLDVLYVIISHASWEALTALMLTSRLLNREAAKHMLRHPDLETTILIDARGDRHVMSFINFLSADGGRCHYLRSLALGGGAVTPRVMEALSDVIHQAINLQSLGLIRAETSLNTYPGMISTLASLCKVEFLLLSSAGLLACQLLKAAHWPLRRVKVINPQADKKVDTINLLNPMICPTLSELVLQGWTYRGPLPLPLHHRLRRIVLVQHWSPVDILATLFPSVKELVIRPMESPMETRRAPTIPRVPLPPGPSRSNSDLRNANAERNRLIGDRFWPSLDVLHTWNPEVSYALALPCPVRTVIFTTLRNWSIQIFKDVMESAHPRDIIIEAACPRNLVRSLLECLKAAKNSLRDLHSLSIRLVQCSKCALQDNFGEWITDVLEALVRLLAIITVSSFPLTAVLHLYRVTWCQSCVVFPTSSFVLLIWK